MMRRVLGRRVLRGILILLAVLLLSGVAGATTEYITNAAYADSDSPNSNYNTEHLFVSKQVSNDFTYIFIELPSTLPTTYLNIYLNAKSDACQPCEVYIYNSNIFYEGNLTWNNKPSIDTEITSFTQGAVGFYNISLINPSKYIAFKIFNSGAWVRFDSDEGANIPYIYFESPPLPQITSWSNNKTNNASLNISVLPTESINFNVTADQSITTWNWFKNWTNQTNNYNNFTTNFSAGNYTISASATNANGTSNTITWNINSSEASASSYDPSGYVNDQNGNPISGATVTLFNAATSKTTISNSTGYWNLSGQIADGAYSYRVTKIGYSDKTGTASIASGGNSLNITLSPAAITPIDVRIAVILAEPSDDSHNTTHNKNYYLTKIIHDLKDYYREVSYGAVNITISPEDVYDNNSNWYKLGKTAAYYGKNFNKVRADNTTYETDNSSEFQLDAVDASDNDINFSKYDAVVVIHANKSWQESSPNNPDLMTTHWMADYTTINREFARNLILNSESEFMGPWAHETGHAMGRIIVPGKGKGYLPDRYGDKDGKHSIGDWDLMGSGNWLGNPAGSNPDHMSSFSKKWLEWLKYKSVGYGTYWINSLATMNYGDEITRYITKVDPQINLTRYYIIETRTNNPAYSKWDTSAPIPEGYSNALVLYQVEESGKNSTVNYIANLLPGEGFWDSSYWDFASKVRFKALEERNRTSGTKPIFEMKVDIQNFSSSWIVGAIIEPIDNLMGYIPPNIWSLPLNSEVALPDLDLHAYAPDGRHVGINYTTRIYENEIQGANASGDLLNGREWIFVPDDIKVQFVVDSKDNQAFLKSYPELQQITNGTQSYNLSIVYDVPDDIRYTTSVEQSVQPDEIWKYNYSIARNTDGTYSVEVDTIPPEVKKPLQAVVKIEPSTLNINSSGRWVKAEIRIPGYSAGLIDVTSIRLNGIIPVDMKPDEITEDDKEHAHSSKLKVKFNRTQVQNIVSPGNVTLYISGKVNGEAFMGSDTIRVIGSANKEDKPKSKGGKS